MKRFLSLFLSALVTFQMINVGCDAASHYRNTAPNYNSIGGAYQGQPVMIMQPSSYIPQKESVINVTLPEQSAPVVNVNPTPQAITVQSPVNIKKVDATTWGDKFAGVLKCVLYALLVGAVVGGLYWWVLPGVNSFDDWVEKKLHSLIVYLAGGEEQLEKKSKSWVFKMMMDASVKMKENKNRKAPEKK